MIEIKKNNSPMWFEQWKEDFAVRTGRKATYKKDFPQDKIRKLRRNLLKEQGYICCYCMGRIGIDNSHLEHFRPKSIFPDEDMDYKNMLASCQGSIKETEEDHCGHRKNDWFSERMVNPSSPKIKDMFRYEADGYVCPGGKDEVRAGAKEMIEHLGLNSYHLVRNREEAIEASGIFDEDYSDEEIQDMVDYYLNMAGEEYVPYCGAIADIWRRQGIKN